MNLPNHHRAFLALIIATSIWGATAAVMKLTLLTIPPFSLAVIRFGAASLLLLPFVYSKLKVQTKDIPLILLATAGAVSIHIPLFFFGLKLTTALNAGIIISTTPIFTLLFARAFLSEKISSKLIIGAIFGIAGLLFIIGKDLMSGVTLSPLGDIMILASILMFVIYEIASKKLFVNYSPFVINFYAFSLGSLTLLPFALNELGTSAWITNITETSIIGIVYGIFLSSFAAYSLWQWGLSKLPASRVGFFFYLDPVVATIAAIIILGEKITLTFILGSLLIFLGLLLAEGRLPYHPIHKLRKAS